MKTNFKPLGIAAAVAAATASYSSVVSAQAVTVDASDLGSMAIVPYYTVREGFGTGVHLTNTSDRTQVVKFRLRRGADSMDALDFNIIMSPKDVWTGFINNDGDDIVIASQDTTCTAPAMSNGRFVMPAIYRAGAEEGYVELIGMGTPVDELEPIAFWAEHTTEGVPRNCDYVRSNFFREGEGPSSTGIVNASKGAQTIGLTLAADGKTVVAAPTDYVAPENFLKASFFVRDADAGLEFGNSAVHVKDFLTAPSITNQQSGVNSGDVLGFDFPDLDGGVPNVDRGRYVELRNAIGGASVINDWSANGDLNVGTDWVITVPGQYTMVDLPAYFASLNAMQSEPNATNTNAWSGDDGSGDGVTDYCTRNGIAPTPLDPVGIPACDFRDIPLTATFDVYDREEQQIQQEQGDLVVSPSLPGETVRTILPAEVNVVTWGVEPVLMSPQAITVEQPGIYGWAELSVEGPATGNRRVCNPVTTNTANPIGNDIVAGLQCVDVVDADASIPMVGFVAWERSFANNPDANYGRIVEHSYGVTSS